MAHLWGRSFGCMVLLRFWLPFQASWPQPAAWCRRAGANQVCYKEGFEEAKAAACNGTCYVFASGYALIGSEVRGLETWLPLLVPAVCHHV